MIGRRGFLASLAALVGVPFLPAPAIAPQSLAFHPEAFSLTMAPLRWVNRIDVLYGFSALNPEFACRIKSEPFRASDNYRAYLAHDAVIQAALA